MDAGINLRNKTQGQKSDAQPDDKNRLSNTAGKNGTSHGVGYGSDSDRQESITRSGINTRNLQITDEAGQIRQTGLTAEETRAKVYTDTTTESARADAGSLHNRFDKEQVQRELDTQTEVTQTFSHTRQHIWSAAATKAQAHREEAENLTRSANVAEKNGDHATADRLRKEAESERQQAKRWQWAGVAVNMVGAGLSAPTQSSADIAANTAVSYVIGQEFKRHNAEGSLGHLLAHATLGGLTAAAGGNDPLAGALSSGGAEAAAGYISGLFGQTDGSRLSAEQKETVTAIAGLLGTAAGAALGNTPADVAQGSLNAKNAVENNWDTQYMQEHRDYFSGVESTARNAFINSKGDVHAVTQAVNDFNTCKGCRNDGHRYVEFLLRASAEAAVTVISGGTNRVPQVIRVLRNSNVVKRVAQNPTVRNFVINGGANAAISAYNDPNDRTATNVVANVVIGGLAGHTGTLAGNANSRFVSWIPASVRDVAAQGMTYGVGSLGKDMVNGKNLDANSAWKSGVLRLWVEPRVRVSPGAQAEFAQPYLILLELE